MTTHATRTARVAVDVRALSPDWGRLRSVPRSLAGALVLGVGLRIAWALVMPVPPRADFATFYQMASLISHGTWWPTSYGWLFQGPLYPTLLAPFAPLGDAGLVLMRMVGIALEAAMIAAAWLLARRTFGPRAAGVASVVAALVPGIWLYAPVLASEHLTVALLTGAMALLAGRRGGRRPFVAGLAAGALVFARPAFIALPVLVLAYLVWKRPMHDRRRAARACALGIAVALAPFAILNQAGGGPPLPIGNAGWQQWLIFNERATGQWFPALDLPDDPFEGLGSGELTDERVRGAQLKLATQYVLANPTELPGSFVARIGMTWTSDRHALEWTIGPTPEERAARFTVWPDRLVDGAYVLLVALAFAGSVAHRRALPRLLPVLVPIGYIVGIHLIAEGNARHHVPALPFLAILAAGAATRPRQALRPALFAAAVIAQPTVPAAPVLVLLTLLVPLTPPAVRWLRGAAHRFGAKPGRTRRVTLAGALVAALGVASIVVARGALEQLAAVDPGGWQAYSVAGDARSVPSHRIVRSGVRPDLRRVSYPDAFELTDGPPAGGLAGAARTLDGLDQEGRYTFYLQVFDPADSAERLLVSLNGRVVWQREEGVATTPGWRAVSVDWLADAPTVTIAVERQSEAGVAAGTPLLIRDLHLYPAY